MRLVLDVCDVSEADVSKGFGSVYYAQSKKSVNDILLADLDAGAGTKLSEGGLETTDGSFFVKGK